MHPFLSETDRRTESQQEKARQGGPQANCLSQASGGAAGEQLRPCWRPTNRVHSINTMILKISGEERKPSVSSDNSQTHVQKLLRGEASKADAPRFDSSAPWSSQGNRFSSWFVYISMGREESAEQLQHWNQKVQLTSKGNIFGVLRGSEAVCSARGTLG